MIIKTYVVPFKRANYFTNNGTITFTERGWGYDGAMYTTANEEEQRILESKPDFKNGIMKLHETIDDGATEKKAEVSAKSSGGKDYPDVTTINEAAQVISDLCGQRLRKKDTILAKANELGITFSNL